VERDVLDDAVALVEDPEHGDALRHRCNTGLVRSGRTPASYRDGLVLLLAPAAARSKPERNQKR
jgi:hypothetical protein